MIKNIYKFGAFTAVAALLSMPYQAQADGSVWDKENWDISIGAGGFYSPKYEGSDEMEFQAVPYIDIEWNERVFLSPGDGLGFHVYKDDALTFSASVGYDEGRKVSDDRPNLNGLGDIDGAATLNTSLSYEMGLVTPYLELSKHMGGSDGLVAEAGVEAFLPVAMLTGSGRSYGFNDEDEVPSGPAFFMGLSSQWTNDSYMEDYFGVTAAQALASGLAQYDAGAGFKSIDAELGVMYPVTDHWSVMASAEYSQLIGDAADSPIVRDENQISGGMFVKYQF